MHLSIPIALLLGVVVLFMIRKDGLKTSHALVAVLFGFLLSTTVLAARIGQVDSMLAELFGGGISQR